MIAKDKDGFNVDSLAILYTDNWLTVLAAPQAYRLLQRPVEPAHLLRLLDIWIAYTERGDHYMSATPEPQSGAPRPALARALRALIAAWTPPELPVAITEAARVVLQAEGSVPRETAAAGWDSYTWDLSDGRTLESYLSWPETEIMLEEAGDAGQRPGS
jgi:hypothetical protein